MAAGGKPMKIGTLAACCRQALADAAGGDPLREPTQAPWSSSALVRDSFGPWQHELARFSLAGHTRFDEPLGFDVKCPNGVASVPPRLDVLLTRGDEVIAVESKCTEQLATKTPQVSQAYLVLRRRFDARATSRWFAALSAVPSFELLDAYQLIKHYLGLRQTYGGRPMTLVYLYWEPADAAGHPFLQQHRREIRRFADLVGDDETCRFVARSYAEHWDALEASEAPPAWLAEHLASLRSRYEVTVRNDDPSVSHPC